MSSRSTPNTSPAPGSMLRGTPTSTTSSARPPRASITGSTSLRSMSRSFAPVDTSSTSQSTSAAGTSSSVIARPPTRRASSSALRRGAVGDDDLAHARAGERERHALAHLAGAEHEDAAVVERAEPAGRQRHRRRRHRHRVAADGGLGAGALAHLDRVAERAREQRSARLLMLGRLPRLAHLAEDLALADDHRVEAGGDAEEVRDRGVVVVRVDEVGELVGIDARHVGEEVAHVLHRRVEQRGVGVDLGAVARGEQHDLGEVLGTAERLRAPSAGPRARWTAARGARRAPCGGSARLRPETCPEHLLGFVDTPGADQIEHAGIERRRQSGSSTGTPDARSSSRASDKMSSSVAYSGPSSSARRRRSHEARAGLRPPVPIVTTRSPWRTTDISVNEQFSGSSAEFTQMRRSSAAANTAWSTSGSPVAVVASQAPSRSAGSNSRSARVERPGVGPGAHLAPHVGRDDVHVGASVEERLDLAGGDAAGADDDAAATRDHQVHRIAGDRGRPRRVAHRRQRRRRGSPLRLVGRGPALVAALLVEGQDLQLDREVDLAQRDAGRRAHDGGREVEDRRDARVDEAVGHLLRRVRGRGDDADGDAALAGDHGEVVERLDGELADAGGRPSRDRRRRARRCGSHGRRSRGSWRAPGRGCRRRRSRPASRG